MLIYAQVFHLYTRKHQIKVVVVFLVPVVSNNRRKLRVGAHPDELPIQAVLSKQQLSRKQLIEKNWADEFIDKVMHNVHTVDEDLDKVKRFINTRLKKGDNDKKIKNLLNIVGWPHDKVEPLFRK